jgi:hypothetical protein
MEKLHNGELYNFYSPRNVIRVNQGEVLYSILTEFGIPMKLG